MKILLINPPSNKMLIGNNPSFVDSVRGHNPCLGLGYIASMILNQTSNHVKIYDCQINNKITLSQELSYNNYDVVGITMTTFTLLDALDVIKMVRRYSPRSFIVAGGTHPTIYPQETLDLGADCVIQGEGETSFLLMLRQGIAKYRGQIIGSTADLVSLDRYPFPLRVDIEQYNSVFSDGMATTMVTSRGCPYNCGFCYRPVVGRTFRARSPANVVREFQECYCRGIRNFLIYDDTFTVDKKRVLDIAKRIIDSGMKIKFDIRSRVNCVDKEMLVALKRAGLVQIHFGVESGVQRILDRINKKITIEQIDKAFALCHRLKIRTLGYIMIGCPDETSEDIKQTEKFVHHLRPDFLHATIFTPFPATPLYEEWKVKTKTDPWLEYAKNPTPDFVTPVWCGHWEHNREYLKSALEVIYKRFYLRPQYMARRMFDIRKWGKYFKAAKNLLKLCVLMTLLCGCATAQIKTFSEFKPYSEYKGRADYKPNTKVEFSHK
ncbi:MAG TPA: radical SAM protein [Candidatus Omnitrophota bacterium]|nr:radical SAM protein [Candidatus Omnitrophota bacterium]